MIDVDYYLAPVPPERTTLPVRVKRLLAGLTMLADVPESRKTAGSYKELQPFIGGARPQVPQALKLAEKYGVVAKWTAATESRSGCTTYIFHGYEEAFALGLALVCDREVSVSEVRSGLASGHSLLTIREQYLKSARERSAYPAVEYVADVYKAPPKDLCHTDLATFDAYPPGDEEDKQPGVVGHSAPNVPPPTTDHVADPTADKPPAVVINSQSCPHCMRKRPGGWMSFCQSGA